MDDVRAGSPFSTPHFLSYTVAPLIGRVSLRIAAVICRYRLRVDAQTVLLAYVLRLCFKTPCAFGLRRKGYFRLATAKKNLNELEAAADVIKVSRVFVGAGPLRSHARLSRRLMRSSGLKGGGIGHLCVHVNYFISPDGQRGEGVFFYSTHSK